MIIICHIFVIVKSETNISERLRIGQQSMHKKNTLKKKTIHSLTDCHFCLKRGQVVLPFPLLCSHIVKWFPSLRNLAANTATPKSAQSLLTSAGMAFGPFKCHLCNSLLQHHSFLLSVLGSATSSMSFANGNAFKCQSGGKKYQESNLTVGLQ